KPAEVLSMRAAGSAATAAYGGTSIGKHAEQWGYKHAANLEHTTTKKRCGLRRGLQG
ncbi:hypothetical protein BaRGS_00001917, partial [Batillaria attramentaria]